MRTAAGYTDLAEVSAHHMYMLHNNAHTISPQGTQVSRCAAGTSIGVATAAAIV